MSSINQFSLGYSSITRQESCATRGSTSKFEPNYISCGALSFCEHFFICLAIFLSFIF